MAQSNPSVTTAPQSNCALLVDDDDFMLDYISDLLEDLVMGKILTATDGKRGIIAYDEAVLKPDLILCDLHMPGSDGFQFMEMLAERGFQGRIILVSGQESHILHSAALMARFHQLNVLGALVKPIDKLSLQNMIAKMTA